MSNGRYVPRRAIGDISPQGSRRTFPRPKTQRPDGRFWYLTRCQVVLLPQADGWEQLLAVLDTVMALVQFYWIPVSGDASNAPIKLLSFFFTLSTSADGNRSGSLHKWSDELAGHWRHLRATLSPSENTHDLSGEYLPTAWLHHEGEYFSQWNSMLVYTVHNHCGIIARAEIFGVFLLGDFHQEC